MHVLVAADDLDALLLVGQVLDGALREEAAVEHEELQLYCCMRVEKERSGS